MSPFTGETTYSLVGRVAARYGLDDDALLTSWRWHGHRPRHESGALRADAEVLLDGAGRRVLAGLCGVGEEVLGRALPVWRGGRCGGRAGGVRVPARTPPA
ncbi:hypothetical protein BG452_04770 [Streptomyces sp. CBMA123]|nr:hypothetical protein [Streptomyces sp. CBMA123]